MALTSNQTGELIATGNWQQVSGAGECAIECNAPFQDAIMADEVTVPTVGHRHAAAHFAAKDNLSSWTIPAGGSVWVKSKAGASFTITANAPLA